MVEYIEADIFIVIPCLVILKALDKDDKHLCKYFLPNLNQIQTKTFRIYFELEKQFDDWKRDEKIENVKGWLKEAKEKQIKKGIIPEKPPVYV